MQLSGVDRYDWRGVGRPSKQILICFTIQVCFQCISFYFLFVSNCFHEWNIINSISILLLLMYLLISWYQEINFWYQKFIFLMSENEFWYQKYDFFFYIREYSVFFYIKNSIFLIFKKDIIISKIWSAILIYLRRLGRKQVLECSHSLRLSVRPSQNLVIATPLKLLIQLSWNLVCR